MAKILVLTKSNDPKHNGTPFALIDPKTGEGYGGKMFKKSHQAKPYFEKLKSTKGATIKYLSETKYTLKQLLKKNGEFNDM
jgi:hypothetical protein